MNIQRLTQSDSASIDATHCPLGIKIIIITTILVFVVNKIFDNIFSFWFLDFPYVVIEKYQIQRLFFTQFIENLFGIFITPFFFYSNVQDIERSRGTVLFLIDFFIKNFLIQVIFLIFALIIQDDYMYSHGLWNSMFVYISLSCFQNPNQMRRLILFPWFFIPFLMPAKYIPFVLMGLDYLFCQNLDVFAAFVLVIIEIKCFKYMIIRPSQQFIQKLENSFLFKCFTKRSDFYFTSQDFLASLQAEEQNKKPQVQIQEFPGQGIQIGGVINFNNFNMDDNKNNTNENSQ